MKKLWLRGVLLGVSLSLLLAGGAALANGLTITPDKDCFTCTEPEVKEVGAADLNPDSVVEFMVDGIPGPTDDLCYYIGFEGGWWDTDCWEAPVDAGPAYMYLWAWCDLEVTFWEQVYWEEPDVGPSHYPFPFEYGEWTVQVCAETTNDNEAGTSEVLECADTTITLAEDCAGFDFVPEPGTIALLGSGLVGLAGYATLRLGSGRALRWRTRE